MLLPREQISPAPTADEIVHVYPPPNVLLILACGVMCMKWMSSTNTPWWRQQNTIPTNKRTEDTVANMIDPALSTAVLVNINSRACSFMESPGLTDISYSRIIQYNGDTILHISSNHVRPPQSWVIFYKRTQAEQRKKNREAGTVW